MATDIIEKAGQAFQLLIDERMNFFKAYNRFPEKIIIGQRMGQILKKDNHPLIITSISSISIAECDRFPRHLFDEITRT